MKLRALLVLSCVLFWQCATPGTPPVSPPAAVPAPAKPAPVSGPDDDHRSVTREEFQASGWAPLPPATGWTPGPAGISVTLGDGRVATLGFVAPTVVRWWVPAAAGDRAFSPAAQYPADPGTTVRTREADGIVWVDTPGLGLRFDLKTLAWVLVRGDKTILHTTGGPRAAGRRMVQVFSGTDAARWVGPGLSPSSPSAKFWAGDNTEGGPALFGAGGTSPFAIFLDNSYQTYTRVTTDETSVGALNGGLDVLVSASAQASGVLEGLSALIGRPQVPPTWTHGTALVLPETETGAFLRKAKVSIQTAEGPFRSDRPRFQALVPAPAPGATLPDLTLAPVRVAWTDAQGLTTLPDGAGTVLSGVTGRADWNTRFDDGGLGSPLARMNNRLPGLAAQAALAAWQTRNPGQRPVVLAPGASPGSLRYAIPEIQPRTGDGALARVLDLGSTGFGTPAVRLDLTGLADPSTRPETYNALLGWLMAPTLTLDWGADPAAFWAGLPEGDQKRLKAILDRRSQFKPLFAQLARQAAAGRPAWAPLWFAAPSDPKALVCDDEYLIGDALLAAPVTGAAASRSVYLPGPGVWFDFWSGTEYGGGQAYDVDARPDKPLLFARGGALVPQREPETFDEKDVYNPLTVHVFPGGRGTGTYWLDDGRTVAWRGGAYWETRLTYSFGTQDMTLDHENLNNPGPWKADPYLLYRIHNVYKPKSVKIDDKPIPLYGDSWGITDTDRSAAWYESDHTLLVKTFHPEKDQTIQMMF